MSCKSVPAQSVSCSESGGPIDPIYCQHVWKPNGSHTNDSPMKLILLEVKDCDLEVIRWSFDLTRETVSIRASLALTV